MLVTLLHNNDSTTKRTVVLGAVTEKEFPGPEESVF